MKVPYTKSGKCGDTVWQRARCGQISYPAFIPYNPSTLAQLAIRAIFSAVSARWRTLTQAQRDIWNAVAQTKWSRPRLGQGRLTGYNYFVKLNVALAHRGLAQVDLPPEPPSPSKVPASSRSCPSRFNQPPVGPTLFLQATRLTAGKEGPSRVTATPKPP